MLASFLPLSFSVIHAQDASSWTIFIYLEATDNLCDMAIKNLTDLALADSDSRITFIAQVHAFSDKAIRYKIEHKKLIPLEYITLTTSDKQNFIDANIWAFSNYKSAKNMLVIWNHGWGILEPVWNSMQKAWCLEPDLVHEISCETCSTRKHLDQSCTERVHDIQHRGFLSNAHTHTMLSNNDLTDALAQVTDQLPHKQFDIIGFDTCMGAQLEISYQLVPYARYQIGCQNCELKDGWDYGALGTHITPKMAAHELVQVIINTYHEYYQKETRQETYTISAIDLSQIYKLCGQLELVINRLVELCKNESELKKIIIETRLVSPGFCFIPMYTDLYAFCAQLADRLNTYQEDRLQALTQELYKLRKLAQEVIIANKTGTQMHDKAHGISIYFPVNHIDSSYFQALFAQKTLWITFLKEIIA